MKRNFFLAGAIILAFTACRQQQQVTIPSRFVLSDSVLHMIALDSVQFCTMDDQLKLSGEVSFNENYVVKVFPRSSGQIIQSKVSLGDKVRRGQILAVMRSADVAGNYSDLNSAEADLSIAKRQLENTQSLYESGIASEREYTEAKENLQKALAQKRKIQSVIHINGGSIMQEDGSYAIVSPIDGYIVEKKVSVGSFIRPDMGDNLFTISDLKTVWVNANVYETDIKKIKEGFPVTVVPIAYNSHTFHGKIDKVSEVLDPASKVMKVRIVLDNKDLMLKPEMFVKITVSNAEGQQSLCVPSRSLITGQDGNYVVVYYNNEDLRVRPVQVIKTIDDQTYVQADSLRAGEKVITKNQLLVFNQIIQH